MPHEIWKTKIKKKVNNIQVLKIYNVYTGEYYFEYESSCIFWGVCYTYYTIGITQLQLNLFILQYRNHVHFIKYMEQEKLKLQTKWPSGLKKHKISRNLKEINE